MLAAGTTTLTALAGCSGDGGEDSETATTATTDTATTGAGGTTDAGETPTTEPTETDSETESATQTATADPSGAVPTFRYDAANTGTRPDGTGPTGDPAIDWEADLDGRVWASPAVVDGRVYLSTDAGTLAALAAGTGETVWTDSVGATLQSSPTVVDDAVLIGTSEGVRALAAETGARRWLFETDGPVLSSPTVADGTVFVGADGGVAAVDLDDGGELWRYDPTAASTAPPDGGDGGAVGHGRFERHDDGGRSPTADLQARTATASTPAVAGGTVYVNVDSSLHAVDASTGRREWARSLDREMTAGRSSLRDSTDRNGSTDRWGGADILQASRVAPSSPAVVDGTVYVGAYPDLTAVDAASGEPRWYAGSSSGSIGRLAANFQVADGITSSPAVAGGRVYAGGDGLSAVSTETGERAWHAPLDGQIRSSPAVVGETVYVGTEAGAVAALSPDGERRWTVTVDGAVTSSPAVVDGVLYAASEEGTAFAIS